MKDVRLALGGVAHKPWRAWKAEAALRGRPATTEQLPGRRRSRARRCRAAAHNGFKIELARRTIVAVLGTSGSRETGASA